MKRIKVMLLSGFLGGLILGLACALPVATPQPGGISADQLLQTLQAAPSPLAPLPTEPGIVSTVVEGVPPEASPMPVAPTPSATIFAAIPLTPPPNAIEYTTHWGDTLPGLVGRFGVEPDKILSQWPIPATGYLASSQQLFIPDELGSVTPPGSILPDSELVYSPSAIDFDVDQFVQQANGYLNNYTEIVDGQAFTGAQIVQRVANELSVNPRLLLAFLEYRSHWVLGLPAPGDPLEYPIGFAITSRTGLYQELVITATQLNMVYYGWRAGTYTLIDFPDKTVGRLNPQLNAGTASLQNLLAIFYPELEWRDRLYGEKSFSALYTGMFGDPWARAALVEPLLPVDLSQPALELPFKAGETWRFSGGPHNTWNFGTPRGALDFSPLGGADVCSISSLWATASTSGLVVRSGFNAVVIDLDGDGFEQTGWDLLYFHLADDGRIPSGAPVQVDDPLGHPSCEGGRATGTHVHLARKYNGEWLSADGPVPFVLSGYLVVAGEQNYQGNLVKGDLVIPANSYRSQLALVTR